MSSWRERVRRAHRNSRRKYAVASGIAIGTYVTMLGLTMLVWQRLFGRLPSPGLLELIIEPIAAVTLGTFAVFGPRPVIGRTPPEEAAADAFFAGKDVRSDDNKFDQDVS
ncbi:MAG: hypothetical protein ACXW3O_15490 [Brevundimonas sp.]